MPGMKGCAVLREIKADTDLRRIPVIMMFSATNSDEDFAGYYDRSANACFRNPQYFKGIL
jgi:CheY-like chemotaxis protein